MKAKELRQNFNEAIESELIMHAADYLKEYRDTIRDYEECTWYSEARKRLTALRVKNLRRRK